MPKKEESKLIVDENTKESLHKEMLKKMSKLKVYMVGENIDEKALKKGSIVLVEPSALSKAPIIDIDDCENSLLLVNYFDIIHIW